MSDAKQGENSPERPEKNVAGAGGGPSKEGSEPRSKNRRRRWRKRKKPPTADVQAEQSSNVSADLVSGDADLRSNSKQHKGAEHNGSEATSDSFAGKDSVASGLGKPKSGKRARRRRGRGRGRSTAPAQTTTQGDVATLQVDAQEAVPKNSDQQNARGRRQRNRSTNGGGHGNNAHNAGDTASSSLKNRAEPNADTAVQQTKTASRNQNNGRKRNHQTHGRSSSPDAYAALDLGTNNCRLLVAVPQQPGRFRVVDAFSRIVRLGEGLAASGKLSEQAMDRAVGALKSCADKLQNRNVRRFRLIATEACRQASNGQEFLDRVEKEAGLKLELIDRETEAKLAVAGCASLVDRKARGVVLFDIGGGSSELALLDLNKRQRHDLGPAMVSWMSLPLGVVTLSEKHGGGKLVTPTVFAAMVDEVSQLLADFDGKAALEEAALEGEVHLLGTSGTVTTLAGIHLELPRYDRRQVDGTWMASRDIETMINKLVEMSFEERVSNPCIGRDRADLVLAGCAILVAIQRMWPCPRLRVADRGLREGLLTEMMNADNAWQRYPRRRHPR